MENKLFIAETERLILRRFRKNVYFWKDETEKLIWKDTYVQVKLNDMEMFNE